MIQTPGGGPAWFRALAEADRVRSPVAVSLAAAIVALGSVAGSAGALSPRIRFEQTTHDFGAMRSDEKKSFDWAFHNDGDAPLTIVDTRPSCGCTASTVENRAIPPGGTGRLTVTFDAAGQSGTVRKSLAVRSDDPQHPVVLLTIVARVTPVEVPQVAGSHPPIAGQSLLAGSCAKCHAEPAAGKTGEALWTAVCAMCHGSRGEGGAAPSLRDAGWLGGHDDRALADGIAFGTPNPRMPGFADIMGGPLAPPQIDSLVKLLRSWGPVAGGASAPSPSPAPR